MGKKAKEKEEPLITYPPLTLRQWIPPDERSKPDPPEKYQPAAFHQKLHPSSLIPIWRWYRIIGKCVVLLGEWSQTYLRYHTATCHCGFQGNANSIICLLYTKLYDIRTWDKHTLNEILDEGNHYYLRSMALLPDNHCKIKLLLTELLTDFYVREHKVRINVKVPTHTGLLYDKPENKYADCLANVIIDFFQGKDCGIICINMEPNKKYFGVWKYHTKYFLFDPSAHDEQLYPWKDTEDPDGGKCFVIGFPNTKLLVQIIQVNSTCDNVSFDITPLKIERLVCINTHYPDCMKQSNLELLDCVKKIKPKIHRPKPEPEPPIPVEDDDDLTDLIPVGTTTQMPEEAEGVDLDMEKDTRILVHKIIVTSPSMIKPQKHLLVEKPFVEDTYYYNEIYPGTVAILVADTHQGDEKYEGCRSNKNLTNALAAIIMLREHKGLEWNSKTLNNVLNLGYRICRECQKLHQGDYEMHLKDLEMVIKVGDRAYKPKFKEYGAMGYLQSVEPSMLDLYPALKEVLSDYDSLILQGPLIVAVWRERDKFFLFDPIERGPGGVIMQQTSRPEEADNEPGFSCCLWFTDLRDLVNLYMRNVERSRRHELFKLCPVEVENYVLFPEDWMNFKAIDIDRWILRGTFSQSNRTFLRQSRNTQCTVIACMALIYVHLVPIAEWNSDTIDEILREGDTLYRQIVKKLNKEDSFVDPMLNCDELWDEIIVRNKLVTMEITSCFVNGLLLPPPSAAQTVNFPKGLEAFFEDNDFAIVTCKGLSVAIFKVGEAYYYFDSHDRNELGFFEPHGKACCQRITTTQRLADIMLPNLGPKSNSDVFNLCRLTITVYNQSMDMQPDEDDEPYQHIEGEEMDEDGIPNMELIKEKFDIEIPLYNYTKLTKKRAVLRGNTHQGNDIIFGTNANKQTVPNLLAAIMFAHLQEPKFWSWEIINDILTFGNDLYNMSMNEYYMKQAHADLQVGEDEDENDDITEDNVIKKYKIGVNTFTVEFDDLGEGILGEDGSELRSTLEQFFQERPKDDDDFHHVIIHTDKMHVVMWKQGGLYYLFDPKPRDERGCVYGKDEWSLFVPDLQQIIYDVQQDPEEAGYPTHQEILMNTTNYQEGDDQPTAQMIRKQMEQYLEKEWKELGQAQAEENAPPIKHPQEYWDMMEREFGRAYIMWSTKLKPLIKHIVQNNPPKFRGDMPYKLIGVTMTNDAEVKQQYDESMGPKEDPVSGDWHGFKEISYGEWILRGTKTMKDPMFPEDNRDRQALAICFVASGYAAAYAFSKFIPRTVDQIMIYGDRLFTKTKQLRREELMKIPDLGLTAMEVEEVLRKDMYGVQNIVKRFCVGNEELSLDVYPRYIRGEVHAQEYEEKYDITRALAEYFEHYRFCIIESKDTFVAVCRQGPAFFMFDPYERGPHGFGSEAGVPCITRFQDLNGLVVLILKNLPAIKSNYFFLHKVIVTVETCQKPIKQELRRVDPPEKLFGFTQIMPGKWILCGSLHQESPEFGKGPNMQSCPIAFVALATNLIHYIEYWSKPIVDDIIRIGSRVYDEALEACEAFNPWEHKMTVAYTPTEFKMGKVRTNCELRCSIQGGIVATKDPAFVNLRKGLENFFEENTFGVLETDYLTVAIWEDEGRDQNDIVKYIYMLDPNQRGPMGMPTEEGGGACALKFADAKICADHIISLLNPNQFCFYIITPVEIVIEYKGKRRMTRRYGQFDEMAWCKKKLKKHKTKKHKAEHKRLAKLGRTAFYKVHRTNFELLRGTRSEANKKYAYLTRGNQDVPNCIAAYVMHKLIPIYKWDYRIIDMILDIGDQLYKDSYILYNPRTQHERFENVIRDIIVKDIRIRISVGAPVMMGLCSSRHLHESLEAVLNQKDSCMLMLDPHVFVLFRYDEKYYYFNPRDVDINGEVATKSEGFAAVLRFENLEELIPQMMKNMTVGSLDQSTYYIIVVGIREMERIPVGTTFIDRGIPIEPPPLGTKCDIILDTVPREICHRRTAMLEKLRHEKYQKNVVL